VVCWQSRWRGFDSALFVVSMYGRVCSTGTGRDRVVYQYEVNQSRGILFFAPFYLVPL
jgi:hypothetical protein